MSAEPYWWSEARELRKRGMSIYLIAWALERHPTTVLYALKPDWREKHKAGSRNAYRYRKREQPAWKPLREKIIRAATYEAEIKGTHVDLVLEAWGEPARKRGRGKRREGLQ